jgi:hypothetical protein
MRTAIFIVAGLLVLVVAVLIGRAVFPIFLVIFLIPAALAAVIIWKF